MYNDHHSDNDHHYNYAASNLLLVLVLDKPATRDYPSDWMHPTHSISEEDYGGL